MPEAIATKPIHTPEYYAGASDFGRAERIRLDAAHMFKRLMREVPEQFHTNPESSEQDSFFTSVVQFLDWTDGQNRPSGIYRRKLPKEVWTMSSNALSMDLTCHCDQRQAEVSLYRPSLGPSYERIRIVAHGFSYSNHPDGVQIYEEETDATFNHALQRARYSLGTLTISQQTRMFMLGNSVFSTVGAAITDGDEYVKYFPYREADVQSSSPFIPEEFKNYPQAELTDR